MLLAILGFVAGIVLVILGADWLTKGASALARRFKISELVIGLTIVALGTSLPELVISTGSAIKGSSGLALGNVIGSSIFNGMLILGVAALIAPIKFNPKMLTREIPFNLLASIALLLVSGTMLEGGANGEFITRNGGLLLLCFLAIFIRYTFSISGDSNDEEPGEILSLPKVIMYIILGLCALIFGGNLFVDGATEVARAAGLSEAVIGITIVSAGSSLPELAVSVSAARKGNVGIALGNVLGSNILNIFFILGVSAVIAPISLNDFSCVDYYVLLASSLLIYIVARFGGGKAVITRFEGALLVAGYVAYTTWLVMNA